MAASIFLFHACKKTNPDITATPPIVTVTASIAGKITDLNNVAVSNATVIAGTDTTSTDNEGLFTIKFAQLDKDAGYVTVIKTGYFTGSRTFLVNPNAVNNVRIQLISKTVSGNFTSGSGGTVPVTGGGYIQFVAGSIVNAKTNTTYSGTVSVSGFHLESDDPNFSEFMPGDLRGVNTSSQQGIFHPLGMVLVEMNDASGDKLQLAKGKTATISLPIPVSSRTNAPATIPLWYFDDSKGLWKQEGSATKQDTNYIGTVSHFTFWAAGQLGADVKLDVSFKDTTNNPLINKQVTITSAVSGTTSSYTDNSGNVNGLVPENEVLVMKVLNGCGDIMYTRQIGPFSADTSLGTILIASYFGNATPVTVTLTGTVVDCSSQPVANGSVQLNMGNSHFTAPVTNGIFNLVFTFCGDPSTNPATISAYDAVNNKQSSAQTINVSSNPAQDIGQLTACNSTSTAQYINLTVHDSYYSWTPPGDSLQGGIDTGGINSYIQGGFDTNNPVKYFVMNLFNSTPAPGIKNAEMYFVMNDTTYTSHYVGNTQTATVVEYGKVNEYISGTASGMVQMQFNGGIVDSFRLPFSVSYRVRRIR